MSEKICMIMEWEKRGDCWTNIGSPDFVREQKFRGYLETRRHGLFNLSGLKKNSMREMWDGSSESLRREGSPNTGFILWECEDISGSGDLTGIMQGVREGEDRETGLSCQQSLLHETVCLLCRAKVSWYDHTGCSEGAKAGLAYSEGVGQGVYGETALSVSSSSASCNRNRRSILEERAYLSDSSKRFGAASSYLVWREG